MHSKFLTIAILFNFIFCQSLLNRAIGENIIFGSPRAYAMGGTNSLNGDNSSLIRYNPSLMKRAVNDNPSFIDFQFNLNFNSERRSILVKDYFGDFLTYADYVNNVNTYNYFQGGFISNVNDFLAVGLSINLIVFTIIMFEFSTFVFNTTLSSFVSQLSFICFLMIPFFGN